MTIKVGDAVMTPGGMGEVLAVTDKDFGVSVLSAGYEQEQWFRMADLTRLVPDDGLSPAKPPPAAVTREDLAEALDIVAGCLLHNDDLSLRAKAARLRGEEKS